MDVVQATNRGVAVTRNVSSEPNCSFGQSFFFAGTVVTTIGIWHKYSMQTLLNRMGVLQMTYFLQFRLWARNASLWGRKNILHRVRIDRYPYDVDALDSPGGPTYGS